MRDEELVHYGVLGMKWGHRSENRSLSTRTQNRVGKKYEKLMMTARKNISKTDFTRSLNAYNKTAESYNANKSLKINAAVQKQFMKDVDSTYKKMLLSDIQKDASYKKAEALCKKYDMQTFNDLAKQNAKEISEMKAILG